MMMKDKKKDAVALILSKKLGQPDESMQEAPKNEDGVYEDSSVGLDSAADEMIRAFEAKDPKMLVEALKSFLEMCNNEQEEPQELPQPE